MAINNIPQFEKRNNVHINVFSVDDKKKRITLLHMSDMKTNRKANLLLYKHHYFTINNMSRLLHGQLSKGNGRRYYCEHCLYSTCSKSVFSKHVCTRKGNVNYLYPFKGQVVKFDTSALHKCVFADFCMYYDFESLTSPLAKGRETENTRDEFKHVPISYGVVRKGGYCSCFDTDVRIYRGNDAVSNFISYLNYMEREFDEIAHLNYKIKWSPSTKAKHKLARRCQICHVSFTYEKKYAHHLHYCNTIKCQSSSNVIASLCNRCNLTIAIMKKCVPILAHNAAKYDNHFIIKHINEFSNNKDIHIIPRTNETFLGLRIGRYQFLDTFEFLHFSLEHLANTLLERDVTAFQLLKKKFPDKSQRALLTKKCIFPYTMATTEEILNTTFALPDKSAFYNILSKTGVTDKEYQRAEQIWRMFHCKTLGDYYDIYLLLDVVLLTDIF